MLADDGLIWLVCPVWKTKPVYIEPSLLGLTELLWEWGPVQLTSSFQKEALGVSVTLSPWGGLSGSSSYKDQRKRPFVELLLHILGSALTSTSLGTMPVFFTSLQVPGTEYEPHTACCVKALSNPTQPLIEQPFCRSGHCHIK